MLGGVVVLAIRRLLPLTLGAVVGSCWRGVRFNMGGGSTCFEPRLVVGGLIWLKVLGVVVVNRLIAVTERISIAIVGPFCFAPLV